MPPKQKAKIKNVQLCLDPDESVLILTYDMYKYDPTDPGTPLSPLTPDA